MEIAAIFDFRAGTHQGKYNFKTASSNAVNSCPQDIQMKKRTEAFSLLLHNTF